MPKSKYKLIYKKKEDKAFEHSCTIKPDAYSMPSKFFADTVYYPATADDTQTFYTQISADLYLGKELIGKLRKSDEFDTAKEAKKWIMQVFDECVDLITPSN